MSAPSHTASQLEALLLASDEPLTMRKMQELLGEEINSSNIRTALGELEEHYRDRGIQLLQIAGGWQFRTSAEHAELVQQLWNTRPPKLSRSALEILAIIAYRQPATRAEVEALRGVRVSSHIIATLQERGWIKVLGRKEVPGRPHLYGTGKAFLTDFGLNSLSDLPDSAQLLDEGDIQELIAEQNQQGDLYENEQAPQPESGEAPGENQSPQQNQGQQ